MVFTKHVDERGMFQELCRDSHMFEGFETKQISLCTINPGFTRGNHYHKELLETFIVIEGEMELTQYWVKDGLLQGEPDVTLMTTENNQLMVNEPNRWHSVTSKNGCKFIILVDREFDSEFPDTYGLGQ